MNPAVQISQYIADFASSPLAQWSSLSPWEMTTRSAEIVRALLPSLIADDFIITDEIAVHRSTFVESGATLKGPLIVGASGYVAAGTYLRGGNWVADRCTFGPGAELKSSFVFGGTKLAHFNFVGDSIVGADVNLEAGSIVCNYRNERSSKQVMARVNGVLVSTGCEKFGALIGDGARLGANSVVAPGALLARNSIIRRTELCDQEQEQEQEQ